MTDDDIIARVQENIGDDEEEDYDIDLNDEKCPSHNEAFQCQETAMLWLEQQEECDGVQLLSLKRLRDLAAKKRVAGQKQKSILDFF